MEANLIKIGNSKGIIIPNKIVKLLGLGHKINMKIEGDKLVVNSAEKKARQGWEEMILKEIKNEGPPEKLLPDFFEDEENPNWKW